MHPFSSTLGAGICLCCALAAATPDLPNILWLTSEDHGPHMGCYGDALARTPNIDALAAQGMRYNHVWSVGPVCSAARTAIITGLYPSSSGGLHHRSKVPLPAALALYPQFLRGAGYYCSNNAKEDYNVTRAPDLWNESSHAAHWRNRAPGQPFFAIFNSMSSHESKIRIFDEPLVTDPQKVRVPAYHPDTPEVRRDWARYYDCVSNADADAGARLRELEADGLAGDTIVFYYADHGAGMPRSKRWPGNSGLQVPLVVYFPPKWSHLAPADYRPGGASDRMVSFVDLAPTLLSLAGIQPPAWMQGHAFAGEFQTAAPVFLFGERGRMDERTDLSRSVTDGRFVYLRHYFPHLPQGQHVAYEFGTPTTRVWRDLYDRGACNAAQSAYWRAPRPPEELFDLQSDPDEVVNLADSPEHAAVLARLRAELRAHMLGVRDFTLQEESKILERSAGSTPYATARDPDRFPLERIMAAADLASAGGADALAELTSLAADPDPAVRYWAAMGLLIRGESAPGSATEPAQPN